MKQVQRGLAHITLTEIKKISTLSVNLASIFLVALLVKASDTQRVASRW